MEVKIGNISNEMGGNLIKGQIKGQNQFGCGIELFVSNGSYQPHKNKITLKLGNERIELIGNTGENNAELLCGNFQKMIEELAENIEIFSEKAILLSKNFNELKK